MRYEVYVFGVSLFVQRLVVGILFGLIVLGASVRIWDAGLACPDWPLCYGVLIPEFDYQIFLEWFHRAVAGLVGLLSLFVFFSVWFKKELRNSMGGLVALSIILFAVQALLGRDTVTRFLQSNIVSAHLMGGYLLYTANLLILNRFKMLRSGEFTSNTPWKFVLGALSLFVLGQVLLGGIVSSNYAGLVCPDFPTCHGQWFPEFVGAIGFKMSHRWLAYLIAILVFGATAYAWMKSKTLNHRVQNLLLAASFLVVVQISLGAALVWTQLDSLLRVFHAFTSLLLYTVLVLGFFNVERR